MGHLIGEDHVAKDTQVERLEGQVLQEPHLKLLVGASDEAQQALDLTLIVVKFLVDVGI